MGICREPVVGGWKLFCRLASWHSLVRRSRGGERGASRCALGNWSRLLHLRGEPSCFRRPRVGPRILTTGQAVAIHRAGLATSARRSAAGGLLYIACRIRSRVKRRTQKVSTVPCSLFCSLRNGGSFSTTSGVLRRQTTAENGFFTPAEHRSPLRNQSGIWPNEWSIALRRRCWSADCSALGIQLFAPEFYGPEGLLISVLDPLPSRFVPVTLEEARERIGFGREKGISPISESQNSE